MQDLEKGSAKKFTKRVKEDISYYLGYYTQVLEKNIEDFTVDMVNVGQGVLDREVEVFFNSFIGYITSKNITVHDCLSNKDLFMDEGYKVLEGSFFTPLGWAEKAQSLALKKIGLEDFKNYAVWDCSCGSGNLVHGLPEHKKLYLSTLNSEDVKIAQARYPEAEVFQLDFLNSYDDWMGYNFTENLPSSLQNILYNNEKLLIIINPPYSTSGINTVVGKYLQGLKETDLSTDLFRQFIWQVCNLVRTHNLSNVDFVLMVSNSLNQVTTSVSANKLLTNTFNFEEGFVFPLNEFSGVLESSGRSVCCSYWWRRDGVPVTPRKEFRYLAYKTDKQALENKPDGYNYYPLEFRSSIKDDFLARGVPVELPEKRVAMNIMGVVNKPIVGVDSPSDVLGWLSWRQDLMRARSIIAVRSEPSEVRDIPITMANFDAVMWYISYLLSEFTWDDRNYMRVEKPIEDAYYHDVYTPNALLITLSCRKNFSSGFRGISLPMGVIDIQNKLFFLEKNEVISAIKENKTCGDILMADLEKHWVDNSWLIERINYALSVAEPEVVVLFQHVKQTLLNSLKTRVIEEDNASSCAYDLGLWQVRKLKSFDETYEEIYTDLYAKMHVKRLELIRKLDFEGLHSLDELED